MVKKYLAALAVILLGNVAPVMAQPSQDDLQIELRIADRLYNDHRWEDAIAAYRLVVKKAPALTVALIQIAKAYRNLGESDKAIGAYDEVLRVDPANDDARNGVAFCHLEKGDLRAAETALNRAVEGHPTREVLYDLGELALAKGRVDDAVQWYRRAKELDPMWDRPTERIAFAQQPKPAAVVTSR
jgi:tetratricopeptide (TPR) repeat protein